MGKLSLTSPIIAVIWNSQRSYYAASSVNNYVHVEQNERILKSTNQ